MQFPPPSLTPSTNARRAFPVADAIFIDTTSPSCAGPLSHSSLTARTVSYHRCLYQTSTEPHSSRMTLFPYDPNIDPATNSRLSNSYTSSPVNVAVTSFKADRCPRCCPPTSSAISHRRANTAGQYSRPLPRNSFHSSAVHGSHFVFAGFISCHYPLVLCDI